MKNKFFILFNLLILSVSVNAQYSGEQKIYLSNSNIKLKLLAKELITYLDKIDKKNKWSITNKKFSTSGVYLGLTKDSTLSKTEKARLNKMRPEGYMIKSTTKSIRIIANSTLGAQHAMFDLLERLGCRFLTPAEKWTIIPDHTGLKLAKGKEFDQPDYINRTIWFANGIGAGQAPDGSLKRINETYKQFFRRSRQTAIAPTSFGHSYYSTYRRNKKIFDKHPEWAGMRKDGTRSALNGLSGGPKASRNWCYSNPELAEFCLQDRITLLAKRRKKNKYINIVSMEPNDFSKYCYCEACKKLGNASDQALHLANYVARGIRKVYPDAKVGILIYTPHNLPPKNTKIEPNVLVSLAMAFNRTGLSYPELMQAWIKCGAKELAIYEYFGVYEWDFGMPKQARVNYQYVKESIPLYFKKWNASILRAQSQASFGRYGPSMYLARKLLWDVDADAEKIYSEYFRVAFGEAAPEMRRLFDFWDDISGSKLSDKNIALWLTMLQKAADKSRNSSPQVQARIEDMKAYLHTVVLFYKAEEAKSLPKDKREEIVKKRIGELLNFVWRTRERQIMQFWGLMTRLARFSGSKKIHKLIWRKWRPNIKKGNVEWMTKHDDYSSKEINDLFSKDLKKYTESSTNEKVYSKQLVPLFPGQKAEQSKSKGYLTRPSIWYFYLDKAGPVEISLDKTSAKNNYFSTAIIKDAKGKVLFSHTTQLYDIPNRKMNKIKLNLKPGLYQMHLNAGKSYMPIFKPMLKSVYEQSVTNSTFNQYLTPNYIYVPKNMKNLRIRNSLLLSVKAPSWKKAKRYKTRMISIPVGNDAGKIWEISRVSRSNFEILNAPPFVATNKANMLIPKEIK